MHFYGNKERSAMAIAQTASSRGMADSIELRQPPDV
jgi:hypothetical protein